MARYSHAATLLNGKVLITGGANGSSWLASAEVYDPATGVFTATGGMVTPRYVHRAVLLNNGKVLITGGYNNNSGFLAGSELYDPASGQWTTTGSMHSNRWIGAAALLANGNVLMAGGAAVASFFGTRGSELYNPATGQWTVLTTGSGKNGQPRSPTSRSTAVRAPPMTASPGVLTIRR